MRRVVHAAGLYFTMVFALGFALGTLRVLVLEPGLGAGLSVLLELPVMLGFSWWACGLAIRWRIVPPRLNDRIAMGGLGFALLMAAELALSTLVFGTSLSDHFQHYQSFAGALGLAGQVVFGLMPALRLLVRAR